MQSISLLTNDEIPKLVSICAEINERFTERIPPWEHFPYKNSVDFPIFFRKIMELSLSSDKISVQDKTQLIIFLKNCLSSLHVGFVLESVQKLVFVRIWSVLTQERRNFELTKNYRWGKAWRAFDRKYLKMSSEAQLIEDLYATFLYNLTEKFISSTDSAYLPFSLHFVDLLITLESIYYNKRFFHVLLDSTHVIIRLRRLDIFKTSHLLRQMVNVLESYYYAEIDLSTGDEMPGTVVLDQHYQRMTTLQRLVFKLEPERLKNFTLVSVASVDNPEAIETALRLIDPNKLRELAVHVKLINPDDDFSTDFVIEIMLSKYSRRPLQIEQLNNLPLYPTEETIWSDNITGSQQISEKDCFALPKLNLQFLSLFDYYTRNFMLFRMESTFEIKQELQNCIGRLKPHLTGVGDVVFDGWARMAQPILNFRITQVGKPKLAQRHPSTVIGELTLHLNLPRDVKTEWESMQRYDVGFLVTVRPNSPRFDPSWVVTVRGCEIKSVLDDDGNELDYNQPRPPFLEDDRVYRVSLDPIQYQQDMQKEKHIDIYQSFNCFMRRKSEVNNFKAVLETIRGLLNSKPMVPDWLGEAFLGYGDPSVACYKNMDCRILTFNWNDTFLDLPHLKDCFPSYLLIGCDSEPLEDVLPPFSLTFTDGNKIMVKSEATKYTVPAFLPQKKCNTVRYTPRQIEAIHSGMQPGLTMIVGPPGTGKTDVAAQIITNLYHNFGNERTLIVTHSNQALNQLFEKLISLDIEERHLLRLGHGEEDLDTDKNFSRYGRVDFALAARLEILDEVTRLQKSLSVTNWVEHNCESANFFFTHEVKTRWGRFMESLKGDGKVNDIADNFPFSSFFAEMTSESLFGGIDFDEDFDVATRCYSYVCNMFERLQQFHPFELLRNRKDRVNYLLVKEARIIAMTCTHAALKRADFLASDFKFDNIVMEEAGRVLEIETFIPLLLQRPSETIGNPLKRWIMLGDHHQLPPIVKNSVLQKYCNMEQSLFSRFINFGVAIIELDMQGRARPSICELYNWRYSKLGSLPHINVESEFGLANPGLLYECQFINVDPLNGIGEEEPTQHFYQNLGEAEYAVALFMYMRLLGYPADKITILSTYNGQVQLIKDIVRVRCASNPFFGVPSKMCTVDKYQGRQNDYILLSLVRTKHIGHLRDVRRLVVALSRARLGLYIFGRMSLFCACLDIKPVFELLNKIPTKLVLVHNEVFPITRKVGDTCVDGSTVVEDVGEMTRCVEKIYNNMINAYSEWKRDQDIQLKAENDRLVELALKEKQHLEELERQKAMQVDQNMIVNELESL